MYPKLTGCILNDDVINQCKNLYKESKSELLDYIESILGQDERVTELVNKYNQDNTDETFWNLMDYLGLTNYLKN